MKNGETHNRKAHSPSAAPQFAKANRIKTEASAFALDVGISYLLSLHSRTFGSRIVRMAALQVYHSPSAMFRIYQTSFVVGGDFISFFRRWLTLVDVTIATGAVDTNFAKYNTIHNTQSTKRLAHYDAFHSVSATSNRI